MPGLIKLNAVVTAHINHLARHHGYPERIKAVDIHREIALSHDISLRTVRKCLAEFRQFGNGEAKTGDGWQHLLVSHVFLGQKGTRHRRACRTPKRVAQVRQLIVSPHGQWRTHKSPREVELHMRAQEIRMSRSTIQRTVVDLSLKPLTRLNVHDLTDANKANPVAKCRAWLRTCAWQNRRMIMSDEKVWFDSRYSIPNAQVDTYQPPATTVRVLERHIKRGWREMPQRLIRRAYDSMLERMTMCIWEGRSQIAKYCGWWNSWPLLAIYAIEFMTTVRRNPNESLNLTSEQV
jgi:hypothetical protein